MTKDELGKTSKADLLKFFEKSVVLETKNSKGPFDKKQLLEEIKKRMKGKDPVSELIALIASATPLTGEHYPALKQLKGKPREAFIIGHSIRHLSASTGSMQKAIEHAEHGDEVDKEMIKGKMFSAIFSLCKLCDVLGISGEELIAGTKAMVEEYK